MIKAENIKIEGLLNVLPKESVKNEDLSFSSEEEKQNFIENVGINQRFIAPKDKNMLFYLEKGCHALLEKMQWNAEEIQVCIVVSQSGLGVLPSLAHQLQEKLQFHPKAVVFDINLGCSAWGFALFQIQQILQAYPNNTKALLCLGDLSSQIIKPHDPSTQFLFSDAFNFLALQKSEKAKPFYYSFLNPGKGVKSIYKGLDEKSKNGMILNGLEVFQYALSYVPPLLKECIATLKDENINLDALVLHQANQLINNSIIKQLGANNYKIFDSITTFGNSGIASIGLSLGYNYSSENPLKNYILACGFGVGFSISAMAFPFHPKIHEIIKI